MIHLACMWTDEIRYQRKLSDSNIYEMTGYDIMRNYLASVLFLLLMLLPPGQKFASHHIITLCEESMTQHLGSRTKLLAQITTDAY